MGDMYYAENPKCPEHGRMSYVAHLFLGMPGATGYVCWGFDGEGCDHTVATDDLDWQLLGSAELLQWEFDRTLPRP